MNDVLHSSYHDLHTNMIPGYPGASGAQNGNDRRHSFAVRQNLAADVGRNIYDSLSYNTAFIAVSILKIITSASILLFSNSSCNKPLNDFLIYMIVHDFLYCAVLFLKVVVMLAAYDALEAAQGQDIEAMPAEIRRYSHHSHGSRQSIPAVEENNNPNPNPPVSQRMALFERRNKLLTALSILVNTYYYVLFIYGQVLYFQPDSNCSEVAPALNGLVLTYICFGYIYIGIPIVFVLVACLCLPFVLLCLYLFSKNEQVPAKKEIIKKLPVTLYHPDLEGEKECSICMVEYNDQDKIIQLKCSPLHFFHEDCLKKWLGINGLCPICRKRIEEDSGQNIELKERRNGQRQEN